MNLRHLACAAAVVLVSACGSSGSDDDSPFIVVGPRWYNQQRKITPETLRDVRFANASQGIAVGDATSIYRTDTGGQTWYQLEHVPFTRGGDILALDFLGNDVHAVGRDGTGGRAWTSVDAVNWTTPDQDGSGAPFNDVDILNTGFGPNLALYLRTDGQIVRSQDGIPDTRNVSPALSGRKTTAIDAHFSGAMVVVGTGGYFAVGSNFGNAWHDWTASPSVATPSGTADDLFGVQIVDWTRNAFFACGENGTIVTTKQDAAPDPHPDLEPVTAGQAAAETLRAIHFPIDLQNGWAVGDGGRIVKINGTFDSNTDIWTFTRVNQTNTTLVDLYAIDMVDTLVGYAVGAGGVVLKTIDGGATWSSPLLNGSGRTQHLDAIAFTGDAARGLAAGQASSTPDATLLRTMDAGATWTLFNTGVAAQDLVAVALPRTGSGTVGYALSTSALYRNSDVFGTGTWSSVVSLPAGTWRAMIAPAGDNTLVLAGDGGEVTLTTTATAGTPTWISATLSGTPNLKCLHAVVTVQGSPDLVVFAGGEGGQLWSIPLTGPPSWTQSPLAGMTADILSLGGASAAQLFAGASDGTIHRLTEGLPLSYTREVLTPPPGAGTPVAVAFPTTLDGWWLAPNGIWTTENASATAASILWSPSPLHLTPADVGAASPLLGKSATLLRGLWMDSAGRNGYAVAQNGAILRTFTGGKEE